MTQEKRKGNAPLPDNLEAVLSDAQRRALPGLELSGWKPRFLRRPLFQEPELVIYNPVDQRAGVLGGDGIRPIFLSALLGAPAYLNGYAAVPLVDALESTAGAAGNSVYAKAIRRIKDDVTTGSTLYNAIKATGLFPNMLLQMMSIGEESGALDEMLDKVATHYEEAVDNAVDSLSSLMEPVIMSILGVLVGGLMIAMYLPIFMLGSVI